jgi:AMMECR1 domain-containing protein
MQRDNDFDHHEVQVPEQRHRGQQLLERLCAEKLNLPTDAWKWPKAKLELFSTLIVGPEPFVHETS